VANLSLSRIAALQKAGKATQPQPPWRFPTSFISFSLVKRTSFFIFSVLLYSRFEISVSVASGREPIPVYGTFVRYVFMNKKLYVGGLSYSTTEQGLRELFSRCGDVDSVNVITDRDTGRSKGFGFVEMANEADAESAIQEYNGLEFEGRRLTVSEAKPQAPRGGGGGGGPRGGGGGGGGGRNRW